MGGAAPATVFAISYRNPDASMSGVTLDDYLIHGPRAALDVIGDITGAPTINIAGLCLGGALTACSPPTSARPGDDRIGTIDAAEHAARLQRAGRARRLHRRARRSPGWSGRWSGPGVLDGSQMAGTFDVLRANDLIFNYVVSNWLMGKSPPAFDILAWNADSTRMPAAMHSFYLRSLVLPQRTGPGQAGARGAACCPWPTSKKRHLHRRRDQRPHRALAVVLQGHEPARRQRPVRPVQRRAYRGHREPARPEVLV